MEQLFVKREKVHILTLGHSRVMWFEMLNEITLDQCKE